MYVETKYLWENIYVYLNFFGKGEEVEEIGNGPGRSSRNNWFFYCAIIQKSALH